MRKLKSTHNPKKGLFYNLVSRKPSYFFIPIFAFILLTMFNDNVNAQCVTTSGQIQGKAFLDASFDGIFQSDESAIQGVEIFVYDADGQMINFSTSDNNGDYSITGLVDGEDYRVEWKYSSIYHVAANGSLYKSDIQFFTAPGCDQNLGLVTNEMVHSDIEIPLVVAQFVKGNDQEYLDKPSLVKIPEEFSITSSIEVLAQKNDLGAIWGLTWKRTTKEMFSVPFIKQYAKLKNDDHDVIYSTDLSDDSNVSSTKFADLSSLGIQIEPLQITDVLDCKYGEQVGKYGLGGITISEDESRLYVANLYSNSIISLSSEQPTAASTYEIVVPDPGCIGGSYRIFALEIHHGKLYVGVTCTADQSNNKADVQFHVYEMDLSSHLFVNVFSTSYPYEYWYDNPADGDKFQQWLTDIEFTRDNNMVLGITDRLAHRFCAEKSNRFRQQHPDILMVWNDNGTWKLENNGKAGPLTGSGVNNYQGPGGGEFFGDDYWVLGPFYHRDIATGSIAIGPSNDEVISTVFDPSTSSFTGGLHSYSTKNGSLIRQLEVYPNADHFFGKASGLGDLEFLLPDQPIEIGNYAWIDLNANGIQDAGEQPVVELSMELYDEDCNKIAATLTNIQGHYVFNESNVDIDGDGVMDGLEHNKNYIITIGSSSFNKQQKVFEYNSEEYVLTQANTAKDKIDSDASIQNSSCVEIDKMPQIEVFVGGLGATDYSFDIGLVPANLPPPVETPKVFDLALRKTVTKAPVKINDIVVFSIEIFNQGEITAGSVEVTDYLPEGLEFVPVLNPGWVKVGTNLRFVIMDHIEINTSKILDLKLKLSPLANLTNITNISEITAATDIDGAPMLDIDSEFDNDPTNDKGGEIGDSSDNMIEDDGTIDEDDHDPAEVSIMDLALIKTTKELSPVTIGQEVTFNIKIINQGNVSVSDVEVIDYLPDGYALSPNNINQWEAYNGMYKYTFKGELEPSKEKSVDILLIISENATTSNLINFAEVMQVFDMDGNDISSKDFDSNPDDLPDNDIGGNPYDDTDNTIDNHGDIDEDDHDPAMLPIFDLALRKSDGNLIENIITDNVVKFEIEVFNQGNIAAQNILITDYLPEGFVYNQAQNANSWIEIDDYTYQFLLSEIIPAGESRTIEIVLEFLEDFKEEVLVNHAEISDYQDINGNFVFDLDSRADMNPENDLELDDEIDDHGIIDEDDADLGKTRAKWFDLALRKYTSKNIVHVGDTIPFYIDIINQGKITADNIRVLDYIPRGLDYIEGYGWEMYNSSDKMYSKMLSTENGLIPHEGLLAGEMLTIRIDLVVNQYADPGTIVNYAELESASSLDGINETDIDSEADDNPLNDAGGRPGPTDDAVTLDASVDEDDHDPAFVYLSEISTEYECLNNASAIDNGQFREDITIIGPPGHDWFISHVTDLYKYPSAAPPASPTNFSTGPMGDKFFEIPSNAFSSFYILSAISLDDTPFTITFENQYGDRHVLNANARHYDHPAIYGPDNVCISALQKYRTDFDPLSRYKWTVNNGGSIVGPDNTAEVEIQWNAQIGGPYTITLVENNRNKCLEPATYEVNIGNQRATIVHCLSNSQMSLDANGELKVTASMLLKGEGYDYNSFAVMLTDANDNPIAANTLTCDYIGQMVTAKVINTCTGNSCWSKILVEDKLAPIIDCKNDTMNCVVFRKYNGPIVVDNCDDSPEIILIDEIIESLCDDDFLKKVTRTYIAKDKSGNVSKECKQELYLERFDFDDVIPAPDRTVRRTNALMCMDYEMDGNGNPTPLEAGVPSVNGQKLYPSINGYCNVQLGYFDVNLPSRGCVKKIIRTWYLFEWWCDNDYLRDVQVQVIEIVDRTAPEVTCPDNITVTTDGTTCDALVWVEKPDYSDNCSDSVQIDIVYPGGFIANFEGGYINLPLGDNLVKFRAYDQCYNVDSCDFEVIVEDKTAPVAICDGHTTISVDNFGEAWVPASTFDDGSRDECQLDIMLVRRMDRGSNCNMKIDTFAPEVGFCCADVGQIIMVEFMVTDYSGNFNICMVEVEVQDKISPVVTPPNDTTINCHYNYDLNDLSEFGQPTVSDNCGYKLEERISTNIDQCRVGYIDRIFIVRDSVNYIAVTQRIHIVNDDPFEFDDITWPLDYTTTTCDSSLLIPDSLPKFYDRPILDEDECDLTAYAYSDEVFAFVSSNSLACYKILRTWKVINWCPSGQSQQFSSWTYEQVIKVENNVAPVITSDCAPLSTCTFDPDCRGGFIDLVATATDDCTPIDELRWEYHIDFDKDGVYDILREGNGGSIVASDSFKLGSHKILWVFEDKCGNKTTCSQDFEILNCKAPVAYCKNGLVVALNAMDLDNDGECDIEMVEVWAQDLDAGSEHSCGYPIIYSIGKDTSIKSITFNCDNKGVNVVEMCVTDINGFQACCVVNIIVQDNNNEDCCPDDFDLPCVIFPNDSLIFDCSASLDTTFFGVPITDSCTIDSSQVVYTDTLDQDSDSLLCNITERNWTVTLFLDGRDTTITYIQYISLDNRFTEDSIIWPIDTIDLVGCNPSIDTGVIGGIPILLGEYCNYVELSFIDVDISDPNDVCAEFERTWSVINHCEDDETFTFVQTIILRNQAPPILVGPADLTVSNDQNRCDANVRLISVVTTDCSTGVTIENDYNGGGANASDIYPVGITTVKFTATDTCGNISMHFVKVTVEDVMNPDVNCPSDTTVNCDTDISDLSIFGDLSASDNCGMDTVIFNDIFDLNICNIGTITRQITAFDTSGNRAFCEQLITIINPGAITIDDITWPEDTVELTGCQSVSPDSTGRPIVDVSGATCSRISISHSDSMYMGTCDGEPCNIIERTWTVIDSCQLDGANGIFTFTQVITIDGGPLLEIACPGDTTINCGSPIGNLAQYGDVIIISSHCGIDSITRDSLYELNMCDVGTITRTFTVVDSMGNSMTCQQIINVVIDNPITESDITWPMDTFTLDTCTSVDPDSTGSPVIDTSRASCYNLSVSHADSSSSNDIYCLIIYRHWEVIDSCQLDSNSMVGRFTFDQVINVIDTVPPVITLTFSDTLIELHPDSCEASVVIEATATDCTNTTITNNSPIGGGGDNANGSYPVGITSFYFYAEDECGNIDSAEASIEIADTIPPDIICVKIIVDMPDTAELIFCTEDYITVLADNCTDSLDIMLTFDLNDFTDTCLVFNCDSLLGAEKRVFVHTIYAKDQYGNIDSCTAQTEIHDVNNVCGNGTLFRNISGTVFLENKNTISTVDVALIGSGKNYITDNTGDYAFNNLPIGEKYVVKPQYDDDYLNGVSTKDIVLVQKYLLGRADITSPYRLIAADVNNSGHITTSDISELRKLVLGKINAFSKVPSWRFMEESYKFIDDNDPFIDVLPEEYEIINLTTNMKVDFIGVKMGDVGGNVKVNANNIENRDENPTAFLTFNIDGKENGIQYLSVGMDDQFIPDGIQFTLSFDPKIVDIKSLNLNELANVEEHNISLDNLHRGLITFSWNQTNNWIYNPQLGLNFFNVGFELKADKGLNTSALFEILSQPTVAEAYIDDVDYNIEVRQVEKPVVNHEAVLYQNHPNPFEKVTTIQFSLPMEEDIVMTILNVNGKVIYKVSGKFNKGLNTVKIDRNVLVGSGIYYYRLDTKSSNSIKKMILMD